MAEKNPIPSVTGLPAVSIPKDFQVDKWGGVTFDIQTIDGSIQINSGRLGLECKGTFAALAAHGLLQADWLPGIPGNNKISQRVIFDEDGPRLLNGNLRGTKISHSFIVIKRLSKQRYSVVIPQTDEQNEFIKERAAEIKREKHARQEREFMKQVYGTTTLADVRNDPLLWANAVMNACFKHQNNGLFYYDQASMERIGKAYNELRCALVEGVIAKRARTPEITQDGNVVYLNRPPAH